MAKYSNDGIFQWARTFGSYENGNYENADNIQVDGNGGLYLSGFFLNGGLVIGDVTLPATSAVNGFLLNFNTSDGTAIWGKTFEMTGDIINKQSRGAGLALHGTNVYWTGYYAGAASLDGVTIETSDNKTGLFIASFTDNGTMNWLIPDGSYVDSYNLAKQIIITDDKIIITGFFQGSQTVIAGETLYATNGLGGLMAYFIAGYSLSDRSPLWAYVTTYPGASNAYADAYSIYETKDHSILIAGRIIGSNYIGTDLYTSAHEPTDLYNTADNFLATYNSDGVYQDAEIIGGYKTEFLMNVSMDQDGNQYLFGFYIDTTSFGTIGLKNKDAVAFYVSKRLCESCSVTTDIIASNQSAVSDLNVYPNPTSGKVTLTTNDPIQKVYAVNTSGQEVEVFNGIIPFKGLVMLRVITDNGEYLKRVVVE